MNLADCLQAAIDAGDLDPDLGKEAQKAYRNRVKELEGRGLPPELAAKQAGDDAAETLTRGIRARRHATAAQMRVMARNVERYSGVALKDPDRILKDIELITSERHAIEKQTMAAVHDYLREFKTDLLGRVKNKALLKDVGRELHLEDTGNLNAKAIADAVLKQYEKLRRLANAYGLDIGKLDDFGVPHTHHADKILRAGYDAWFTKLYDGRLLDWARIVSFKTGKPFAIAPGARPLREDADAFLKPIFDQITTKGWVNREPSMAMVGKGMAATRGEHRALHFLNADAWMKYNDAFGRHNLFEAVITHLRGLSRDIALMRTFGPSPTMGLNHALQVIEKASQTDKTLSGAGRQRMIEINSRKARKARVMLRTVTGENAIPGSQFWATFFGTGRTLLVPAQLGSAVLSSVTDWVSVRIAAKAVRMNPNGATVRQISQIAQGLKPEQARDLGFIMDSWFDTMANQARFLGDVWQPQLADRLASGVMRATFLNHLTDSSRVAVAAAFGSDLADMAHLAWKDLPQNLRNFWESRRITPADWDAMRDPAVIHTDRKGGRHINATWFREHTSLPEEQADDLMIRWGAMVQDQVETAVPTASLRGRATILGDAAPGTFSGELLRSTLQYKSYPLSVMFNQMRRIVELDGGATTRAAYVAKYIFFMTIAGAVAVQLKEASKLRDPRPMNTKEFWGAALMQGGGIGIFGDFFSSTTSRTGGGLAETLAGPVVGAASDFSVAAVSNATRLVKGEKTFLGRDVVNLARRYNPLATFQPPIPIPIRGAIDRMVWDQLQLALDPEAEVEWRRAEKRLKREYGTQSWWRKGQMLPDRAPDLNNALPP